MTKKLSSICAGLELSNRYNFDAGESRKDFMKYSSDEETRVSCQFLSATSFSDVDCE